MTSHAPIKLNIEQAQLAATDEVYRWRGHCMEQFARLERAVNATYRHWHPHCQMPQKFSERIKALEKVTAADGTHPNEALSKRLCLLRQLHVHWRDCLAHGTSAVHLDAERKWIWHYDLPRVGQSCDKVDAITKAKAIAFEAELADHVDWLRKQVKHLRIVSSY